MSISTIVINNNIRESGVAVYNSLVGQFFRELNSIDPNVQLDFSPKTPNQFSTRLAYDVKAHGAEGHVYFDMFGCPYHIYFPNVQVTRKGGWGTVSYKFRKQITTANISPEELYNVIREVALKRQKKAASVEKAKQAKAQTPTVA